MASAREESKVQIATLVVEILLTLSIAAGVVVAGVSLFYVVRSGYALGKAMDEACDKISDRSALVALADSVNALNSAISEAMNGLKKVQQEISGFADGQIRIAARQVVSIESLDRTVKQFERELLDVASGGKRPEDLSLDPSLHPLSEEERRRLEEEEVQRVLASHPEVVKAKV
jgi:hypothetical protein